MHEERPYQDLEKTLRNSTKKEVSFRTYSTKSYRPEHVKAGWYKRGIRNRLVKKAESILSEPSHKHYVWENRESIPRHFFDDKRVEQKFIDAQAKPVKRDLGKTVNFAAKFTRRTAKDKDKEKDKISTGKKSKSLKTNNATQKTVPNRASKKKPSKENSSNASSEWTTELAYSDTEIDHLQDSPKNSTQKLPPMRSRS